MKKKTGFVPFVTENPLLGLFVCQYCQTQPGNTSIAKSIKITSTKSEINQWKLNRNIKILTKITKNKHLT